jgi:hypothetical protein
MGRDCAGWCGDSVLMMYRSHYPPVPAHPRWVGAGSAGAQDIRGMVWDGWGMVGGWYGMVWDGLGWYGMVWDGMGLEKLSVLRKCD